MKSIVDQLKLYLNDYSLLSAAQDMVNALRSTASSVEKQSILRRYSHLKHLLAVVYNPHIRFNVSKQAIDTTELAFNAQFLDNPYNLAALLQDLYNRHLTGDAALIAIHAKLARHPGHTDLITRIIDKDLGAGISVKTINAVFKGLIPEFNVPLAKDYDPNKHKIVDASGGDGSYYISRKLDGVRCLAFIYTNGDIKFFTRGGKEIKTLDVLHKALEKQFQALKGLVLDGELCILQDGIENFQAIVSEFRRKYHTIEHPKYYVFDAYPIDDFVQGKAYEGFEDKYRYLQSVLYAANNIEVLQQRKLSPDYLDSNSLYSIPENWEGYMLRGPGPTVFKRSNNLLKVKNFKEIDVVVLDVAPTTMYIDGEERGCVGTLICRVDDTQRLCVGSGLTWSQRVRWLENPEQIIGEVATVKYFRETTNKHGEKNFLFPTFKSVRTDLHE
jgi:DNA ligase-1